MLYLPPPSIIYIQQHDTQIARTTCENLIPKGQEILKDVTETLKDEKLLVSIDFPLSIIKLNVKTKYYGALWMFIRQLDGSVDFKVCSKDRTVRAKWVQMEHYSKKEWLEMNYD